MLMANVEPQSFGQVSLREGGDRLRRPFCFSISGAERMHLKESKVPTCHLAFLEHPLEEIFESSKVWS